MNLREQFLQERKDNIRKLGQDKELKRLGLEFLIRSCRSNYSYNFDWMGRPIIQFTEDMVAMQELLWKVQPDLLIETGIAHGGSLIYYASIMELMGKGEVLGVDIDIRPHNREAIEAHPMFKRITMIQGSSIDEEVMTQVRAKAEGKKTVMVCLDSNHTHAHALREMELYSPLVAKGSYMVVFDTIVEDMPDELCANRPWGKGNNPKTAVWEFLKTNDRFVIDHEVEDKIVITVAPDGYLKCIKDCI